jgi:hypothetical protein
MRLTPSKGRTIVSGPRFYTANDSDGRDPASYVLEGSNDGGASYTLISSNSLALPTARNAGGTAVDPLTQNLQQVLFPNTASFSRYRLSFPNVRTPASNTSMQIGEIELLGVPGDSNVTLTVTPPTTPGGSFQLSWPAGRVLMEADVVTGPYTWNNAATSPFTVNPTAPQKCHQVIAP